MCGSLIAVAIKPRCGAYLVVAWLAGIVMNLLSYSGYYDVAVRDFGLMLAALTLARLASKYDPPGLSSLHLADATPPPGRHCHTNGTCLEASRDESE